MTDQSASDSLEESRDTTVVVQRSVSQPVKEVWRMLATPAGAEALLGEGGMLGDKGDSWHAADGTYGVVRSFHPLEQIRFSWHAAEEAPKTIVEVDLAASGDGTRVEIRHEHIPHYFDAAALQYVRKIAGTTRPSRANQEAFDEAVDAIAQATAHLLGHLTTSAPPKNREEEAAKARARAGSRRLVSA